VRHRHVTTASLVSDQGGDLAVTAFDCQKRAGVEDDLQPRRTPVRAADLGS